MIRYCLPIQKSTLSEVRATIDAARNSFTYFEIWLDYIQKIDLDELGKLIDEMGGSLIFLSRRQNLESPRRDISDRNSLTEFLARHASHAEFLIDFDIETQLDEIAHLRSLPKKIPTILSFHNYSSTPSNEELRVIVQRALELDAIIVKVATFCQSQDDAIRLLQLQSHLRVGSIRHIVLGMGENGIITRIFGTLWGNEMIFAPLTRSESSAPGQLDRDQLESIFNLIQR